MILLKLIQNKKKNPKKIAIQDEKRRISYENLLKKSFLFSEYLKSRGIKKNQKIFVYLENSIDFSILFICAQIIGFIIVPINSNTPLEELEILSKDLKIKKVISKKEFLKNKQFNLKTIYLNNIKKKLTKKMLIVDEIKKNYILSFSSGSTGKPKKIILSNKTKYLRAYQAIEMYNIRKTDNLLISTPFQYTLAQRILHMSLIRGCTLFIMNNVTPKLLSQNIKKNNITFFMTISMHLRKLIESKLLEKKYFFKSLKSVVSSSDSLSEKNKRYLLNNLNCDLHEIFGLAELGTISNLHLNKNKNKLKSVGKICKDTRIKIVEDLKNKKIGLIFCKSPRKYDAFFNDKIVYSKKNLYFNTGDLGKIDHNNFLYFLGRKKNIIKSRGINIYPLDIENEISNIKGIKECKVFGISDEIIGEKVVAAIIKEKSSHITKRDIFETCIKKLKHIYQPSEIKFYEKFPKNKMGKVLINELKRNYSKINKNNKYNLSI